MNLIWARRNINEYQFWHLITLLTTHNRHFNNVVLPSAYEVFPTQFFTADVIDQATYMSLNLDGDIKNNKLVIMSNYTTGVLGSNDNDDNDNVNDLNDIKNGKNKINDWDTLKKVMTDIKFQQRKTDNYQLTNRRNKDIKNKIQNNNRNLNQGNKFDNNGEDRMVYFTEDIGLNNYYYFSRMANSRIVDNKQMYNNDNNKENINMKKGKTIGRKEVDDKINRRGERYLYQMKQLLARFNLERKSNGLDNVQDITLDGVVDNGVYANLRYTNGLQMPNRQNEFNLKKQHNTRLIQVTKDFENRFNRAIDQGYVETQNGHKVDLRNHNGINILGNLLQGNRDSVNNQYYRYLEYYYRLLLGGNNNDNVDFDDIRFVPTVMDHHETSMRDSVFWQMCKRITNVVDKFKNKLVGYKTYDVDFKGVKINNVKVDKMVTTFNYFDSDITNGIKLDFNEKFMCKRNNGNDKSDENDNNDSNDSGSDSSSEEDVNGRYERNEYKLNKDNKKLNKNDRTDRMNIRDNKRNSKKWNKNDSNDLDSNESNSSSNESNDSNDSDSNEFTGRRDGNYKNGFRGINHNGRNDKKNMNRNGRMYNKNMDNKNMDYMKMDHDQQINHSEEKNIFNRFNNHGTSKQINYYKRAGNGKWTLFRFV